MRRQPILLGAISLDLFAMFLGGTTALLPIFARDILHTGPAGLGFLRTAPAVGAAAVALVLARWQLRRHVGMAMFTCVAIFGAGTVVFGLSHNLALSLAALVVAGAGDMISVYVRSALVQLATPDDMRGRIGSVNSLFIGASNEFGEFRAGMTAGLFGTVPAVVIGGLGTLTVVGLWMKLFPALRRVDRFTDVGVKAVPGRSRARCDPKAVTAGEQSRDMKKRGGRDRPFVTCQATHLLRLRHNPQVGTRRFPALRIDFLRIVIGDGARDDDILTRLPVHRRCDFVFGGELERVDDPQHFIEIAAGRHRIDQDRFQFLVRSDDIDIAHRLIVGSCALGRHLRMLRPGACRTASRSRDRDRR